MRNLTRWLRALPALWGMLLGASVAQAAYLTDLPITLTQPDGTEVSCFASGDEYYNWAHDSRGYVIMPDPETGWLVYGAREDGRVVPTPHVVGRVDPAAVGLKARVMPDAGFLEARRTARQSVAAAADGAPDSQPAARTGNVTNIVIFIRFSDETEFTTPRSTYQSMLNATSGNSLYNYYREASYGKFFIQSQMYPTTTGTTIVSYQDIYPRAYFKPYNATTNPTGYQESQVAGREHALLARAITAVRSQIPTDLNVDTDNDGNVDNIVFVIKGATGAWSDLLWPHAWALYSTNVSINGKRVWSYSLQLNDATLSSGVGVLAHETGHTIGMPDLYRYNAGEPNEPVAGWDLMAYNANPPQHMGAYMKWRYLGWISSIPEITTPGTYTLNPLTSPNNNCYKIKAPNSTTEYFVVEYRRQAGTFEAKVPGSGLVVYRINTAKSGAGNAQGPPDEIYIYRPGGTPTSDGQYWTANYSSSFGRSTLTDTSSPSAFLSGGGPSGLVLTEIGPVGSTISFKLSGPGPTQLRFAAFSGQGREGEVFPFAVRVGLLDASGKLASGSTLPVTVSLKPGTGTEGAVLSGTRTVNAVGGIAQFPDLRIDKAGTGYVLTATANGPTSSNTTPFAVAPFAFQLGDAPDAMRWAAGFAPMPDYKLPRWDVVTEGDSAGRVDFADVTSILLKSLGLAPNP